MKQLVVTAALAAAPLLVFSGPALAGPGDAPAKVSPKAKAEAKAHINKATEAHQAGNFEVARTELEAAYALDPEPDLLYALGQVHVKLGRCADAIGYYQKYLATNPAAEPMQATNEAISNCRQQLAAEEAAKQPPPPAPAPTPAEPVSPPPPPIHNGAKFDVLGASLVGVGVISSAVGIVMYSSARSSLDDAENAATYEESASLVDDAHSKRTYAIVFGAVGIAAIGVGAWHFVHSRGERNAAPTASLNVAPTKNGGLISWQGSF